MSNVAEFIEIRNSIEALAKQIIHCIEQNAIQTSKQHLDEAEQKLETLTAMVDNDVQVIVSGRLTRQLTALRTKTETMAAKAPARKKAAAKKPAAKKAEKADKPAKPVSEEAPEIVVFERP